MPGITCTEPPVAFGDQNLLAQLTQGRPAKESRMEAKHTRTEAYNHRYLFQNEGIVFIIKVLLFITVLLLIKVLLFMSNLSFGIKVELICFYLSTLILWFVMRVLIMNQRGREATYSVGKSLERRVEKSHQLKTKESQHWESLRDEIMNNAAHPYRLVICVPLEYPTWPLYTNLKYDFIWNMLDAKTYLWTKCNRVVSANQCQRHLQSYCTQPTSSVSMHTNEILKIQTVNCNSAKTRHINSTKKTENETEEIHTETKQPPGKHNLPLVDEVEPVNLSNRSKQLCRMSVCQAIDKAILKCGASSHHSGPVTVGHGDNTGSEETENAPRDCERTDVEDPMPEELASVDMNEKKIKTTEGSVLLPVQDDQGIPEIRELTQIPLRNITVPKTSVVNILLQTSVLSTAGSGSTRHSLGTVETQATPQTSQSVVETDGNSGTAQNNTSIVTQATTQTLQSVVETDGNSGAIQNNTSVVTQATTQTLQSVVETDGNSGTAQNNTSVVTQATTQTLQSVVETDGNTGTTQNNTSVVTQATTQTLQSVVETDGNSGTAQNNTSVVTQATTQTSEETDGNRDVSECSPTTITHATAQTQQATGSETQVHEESELDKVLRRIARGEQVGPRITMRFELLRLCTLRNYPRENKPFITRLSAAGFYFAAEADELICYCCGIRKRDWSADSNPMAIHRRLSPNCSFLTNNASVNVGVPRGDGEAEGRDRFANLRELLEETPGAATGSDTTLAARVPASDTAVRVPGSDMTARGTSDSVPQYSATSSRTVANQNPRHPHYGVYSVRLNSFVGWPTDSGQSPATLAEAGFYFAGIGDCVRCFHCGVGLRHWAEEDEPWIEHGRWSLQNPCHYLLQMKGEEFLSLITMALEITQNQPPAIDAVTPEDSVRVHTATQQSQSSQPTNQTGDHTSNHGNREQTTTQQPSQSQPSTQTSAGVSNHGNRPSPGRSSSSLPTVGKGGNSSQTGRGHLGRKGNSLDIQRQLQEENRRLRQQTVCRVCELRETCIVFLPCGHLVACAECAPSVRSCMVCKKLVKGTVKTFMS